MTDNTMYYSLEVRDDESVYECSVSMRGSRRIPLDDPYGVHVQAHTGFDVCVLFRPGMTYRDLVLALIRLVAVLCAAKNCDLD